MVLIEVIGQGLKDCLHAEQAGADRIELVSSLALGGLTPSLGLFQVAKEKVNIPIVVMVRPRGAGTYYSEYEKEIMKKDCNLFLQAGADGIVFGALDKKGHIDTDFTKEIVKLCHSYNVEAIFHRAFDLTNNPSSIEELIKVKVDRVLTSGFHGTAVEGILEIKKLIDLYGKYIQIIPGAGINSSNLKEIINKTGAQQVHFSAKTHRIDPTTNMNPNYSMGYLKVL